jgi:hypothetical protein
MNNALLWIAVLEKPGLPALRTAFTGAAVLFLLAGAFIWRKRHQFFDRDPAVENDPLVVRHNRAEEIVFVWAGLTFVLLCIAYELWSA